VTLDGAPPPRRSRPGPARFTLDPAFAIGPIDRRLFGSFVEHMGRCVYTGIYEPGHPAADRDGLRTDVLELTRELGVTVVRYPGGNFVSGYRWEDGVGPDRPTRLDLAWRSIEPNTFGLGEFVTWARLADVEPMLAVNLGTRGIQEAADLVEYANHPGGTHLSDLRAAHGAPQPFGVRLWCLGNELDGPWQIGHKTADEYGRLAAETARAMRLVDPSIELVACGSSGRWMPTFGTWEETVLDHTYDEVDYLSLHAYHEPLDGDLDSFLATGDDVERFVEDVVAVADAVRGRKRSRKLLRLSFDEWNVWYQSRFPGQERLAFEHAPRLIEDEFTVADAVVVGGFLVALLRHADRVGVACQAQLANIIAPIRTEPGGPAWRQTIFHPFAHTARLARGVSLRVEVDAPLVETARFGEVPLVAVAATHDAEAPAVSVFAVHRGRDAATGLEIDLRALEHHQCPAWSVNEHLVVADRDSTATNSQDQPDRVVPRAGQGAEIVDGVLRLELPPVSWTALHLVPGA
jgi:alpha-N-arabinofuranosidase